MSSAPQFNRYAPIDLHTHSIASDGTQRPREVVRTAAREGIGTIALTDHDTTAGWAEAADAAHEAGITFIPGLEFSTQIGPASVHVLGYLVDPENADLVAEMNEIRDSRLQRAERMVERIGADYDLSWADVLAHADEQATVGRPHIADALVSKGIVADRSAAFDTILHWQGGYYRPHHAPPPERAIELIRAAGGVPVLAHPATRGRHTLEGAAMGRLVDAGLLGVEIEHRENDSGGKEQLRMHARRFDLIVTGSSDYHGSGKPNRLGENTTEPDQLQRIIDAGTGSSPVFSTVRSHARGEAGAHSPS